MFAYVGLPQNLKDLKRSEKRFRGGLVCKACRLVYHSTLGSSVVKKMKKKKKRHSVKCVEDFFLKAKAVIWP